MWEAKQAVEYVEAAPGISIAARNSSFVPGIKLDQEREMIALINIPCLHCVRQSSCRHLFCLWTSLSIDRIPELWLRIVPASPQMIMHEPAVPMEHMQDSAHALLPGRKQATPFSSCGETVGPRATMTTPKTSNGDDFLDDAILFLRS